jgi:DNA mismatch repair protein MutS2
VIDEHTLRVLEFYKVREAVAKCATSEPGRQIVGGIVPETDFGTVERSLKEVSELRSYLDTRKSFPLSGIKDIRPSLRIAATEGAMLMPDGLLGVMSVAKASRLLGQAIKKYGEGHPLLKARSANLAVFETLEAELTRSIDDEGEILDSASPELRRIRRSMSTARARIQKELEAIIHGPSFAKYVQEPVITMRGDRYVLPLKPNYKMAIKGIVHDHSATRSTVFVEPEKTVELNNKLTGLKADERTEIERILWRLTALVREDGDGLGRALEALSYLDALYARATYALEIGAMMPVIKRGGAVELRGARHPLLIKAIGREKTVPVDVSVGGDFNCIVITGPNTGGKTVTLKTVGLLALMAQAGLLIPASPDSVITVFNNVFSDIGDEQGVEQNLSTFSAHIINIVRLLKDSDRDTLVLLDELGAGTDPAEGSALGVSILEELNRRKTRVIVTTHHGALKVFAANTQGVTNASVEFDPESLGPTYRLLIGTPGKSNALHIARRFGMPDSIIDSAAKMKDSQDVRVDALIDRLETEARSARKDREKAAKELYEARLERSRLEEELQKAENERKDAGRKAKEKAAGVLSSLRMKLRELEGLNSKAGGASKDDIRRVSRDVRRLDGELKSTACPAVPEPEVKVDMDSLKAGDNVRVYKYNKEGRVLSVDIAKRHVVVEVGALKITLGPDELEPVSGPMKARKVETAAFTLSHEEGLSADMDFGPSGEIKLIGLRAEEAIEQLDKYLDKCLQSGMVSVRIIHGRGTGALKRAVAGHLEGHLAVAKYGPELRGGPEGGGLPDEAVTVATLKT